MWHQVLQPLGIAKSRLNCQVTKVGMCVLQPSQGSWTRMNSVTQLKPINSQLPGTQSVPLQSASAAAAAEAGAVNGAVGARFRQPAHSSPPPVAARPIGLKGNRNLRDPLLAQAELIAARLLPPVSASPPPPPPLPRWAGTTRAIA